MNKIQSTKPKISLSISDLPIGVKTKSLFALAESLKVDGVELVIGYKTGFTIKKLENFSKKYNMPILSIHQPVWCFTGIHHSEKPFQIAKHFKAKYVAHPSFTKSLNNEKTKNYLEWLFKMKEKYEIEILIENMPQQATSPRLRKFIKRDHSITDLLQLKAVCEKYGFGMTLDTSHLNLITPHKAEEFLEIQSLVKNIHLSDFDEKYQHLSLGKGILETEKFLNFLKESNYSDFITLELHRKFFGSKRKYVKEIEESIKFIQRNLYPENLDEEIFNFSALKKYLSRFFIFRRKNLS